MSVWLKECVNHIIFEKQRIGKALGEIQHIGWTLIGSSLPQATEYIKIRLKIRLLTLRNLKLKKTLCQDMEYQTFDKELSNKS